MIENMPYGEDKVDPDVYAHYMGVARFWRAYRHWQLIKEYSDIPWLDHVVDKDEDMLYAPRDDREYVFHKLLEDIDYACTHCMTSQAYNVESRTVINGYIALALKAKMCLYEGSYRKYHRTNPASGKEWNGNYETADDLYAAAIDACRQLIGSGVFSLHTGNPMSAYSDLFLSEDIPSEEVIWSRQANEAMNIMHQTTLEYNSPTAAQKYSPTKELVSMYLNLDGTPVATDKVSVADEFTGRDYRLAQTVMGPGHTWLLNNGTVEAKAPNWTYVLTGYEFCKWNIEKQYCYTASRCNNSMPIIRYAEILLIYAEAMEETGQMDESVWESTVGAIRRRSGVTSIYPGSAAYKADPILTAYYNGDGIGKDVSNTMLEIRRERVTELCMEWNNRHDDLYRWAEGPIIARRYQGRGWRGIWVTQAEANNGISFNYFDYTVGQASNTARNYPVAKTGADLTWSLSEGNYGYLVYNYALEWSEKMYTYPISTKALTLNPGLGQNYGW